MDKKVGGELMLLGMALYERLRPLIIVLLGVLSSSLMDFVLMRVVVVSVVGVTGVGEVLRLVHRTLLVNILLVGVALVVVDAIAAAAIGGRVRRLLGQNSCWVGRGRSRKEGRREWRRWEARNCRQGAYLLRMVAARRVLLKVERLGTYRWRWRDEHGEMPAATTTTTTIEGESVRQGRRVGCSYGGVVRRRRRNYTRRRQVQALNSAAAAERGERGGRVRRHHRCGGRRRGGC